MPEAIKSQIFSDLADKLIDGAVGVMPTDTVYGLVCRAGDVVAVGKLYKIKARDNKPGTIIAANIDQLVELGIKRAYLKAVEQFWPGAISVVIPFSDPAGAYLRLGKPDIAIRIPADENLQTLLLQTGALLTSSANLPGKPPANTIAEAKNFFKNNVDFYVNGGNLAGREPSTIIRMIDDAIEVIRPGAVKIDEATGRLSS